MKDKQYLKEHKAEALKKIAEAMGKIVFIRTQVFSYKEVCYCDASGNEEVFDPLTNAEQWIECLIWYRRNIYNLADLKYFMACICRATESREALLVAILELKGV